MAFTASLQWDVRTTGSDSNGGAFDTTTSGTDYSQQNSPQVVFTDLVIGATTTQITSVANPFTSAYIGNVINITSGTGFTVQRIQVISVTAGVATCDKAVGTAASTGGHGNLGGSMLTIAAVLAVSVSLNFIHIKAGTYTITATINVAFGQWTTFQGYQNTHGDRGTKPLITTSTASVSLFSLSTASIVFRNLAFSNTSTGTRFTALQNGSTVLVDSCTCVGCGQFYYGNVTYISFLFCTASACPNDCIDLNSTGTCYMYGCKIFNNIGAGILCASVDHVVIENSVFYGNGGPDVSWTGGAAKLEITNNVFYSGSDSGLKCTVANSGQGSFQAINNIFYGKGAFGMNFTGGWFYSSAQYNNAFGANTSGNRGGTGAVADTTDIPLTVNPFNNASGGDFTLNDLAGGGLLCRGAGVPAFRDIGAFQTAVGILRNPGTQGGMNG